MTQAGTPQSRRRAAGWALGSGAIHQFSQVAVSLTLAALLGAEAFGVIALASIYVLLIEFLVRAGMQQAIIQREHLEARHTNAAYWMSMGLAVILALVTLGLAGVWADINNAPSLEPLLIALSGLGLFQAQWQVPIAVLQRDLDFKRSEIPLNIGTALGGLAGVIAAFLGAEEWAIVVQLYTYGVIGTVLMYRATTWRPRLRFSTAAARDLLPVSSGALLASLGGFFSQRADSLLLGVFFGPLALGLYRFGARFVQLIINVTSSSLGPVALVVLSREQGDPDAFRRSLRSQLAGLNLLVFPALGVLLAVAPSVAAVFGDEWRPVGPALRILCLAGMARSVVLFASPILQSIGLAHRAAATQWFSAGVHVVMLIAGGLLLRDSDVQTQIVGVATVRLIAQGLVISPALLIVVSRATRVSISDMLTPLAAPAAAAAAAMGAGLLADEFCRRSDLAAFPRLVAVGAVATMSGLVVLVLASAEARRLVASARALVDRSSS